MGVPGMPKVIVRRQRVLGVAVAEAAVAEAARGPVELGRPLPVAVGPVAGGAVRGKEGRGVGRRGARAEGRRGGAARRAWGLPGGRLRSLRRGPPPAKPPGRLEEVPASSRLERELVGAGA